MNLRTFATSVYVATNGYVWYIAFDMLEPVTRSVGFAICLFLFLVAFYRRKGCTQVMSKSITAQNLVRTTPAASASPLQATPSDEMRAIARSFRSLRLGIKPVGAKTTPDYEIYFLAKTPDTTWGKITEGTLDEVASAIYENRGGGDPVSVMFNRQPPYLLVTSREQRILPWSSRVNNLARCIGQVGAFLDGTDLRPLKINIADPDQAFVGVFSASGGGKSMLLKALALSIMENADPNEMEFYFIDVDSNQFDSWRILPHCRAVAETEEQALALISYLVRKVEEDRSLTNRVRRVLVIDELQILTAGSDRSDEFIELLGKLAQQSRKHLGNLLTATQDPSGNNYPTPLQRNTKVYLAGLTADPRYLNNELKISGSDKLRGKGDFLCKFGGRQISFKGYFLSDADIQATLDAIVGRWGINRKPIHFANDTVDSQIAPDSKPAPAPLPEAPVAEAPEPTATAAVEAIPVPPMKTKKAQVELDAEKLKPYLDEAYDFEAGQLRYGQAGRLIEVLYGEPKPNAGGYKSRLDNAVSYALAKFY